MSFFENQARARRNTTLLMVLYLLSVVCLIFTIYFGMALILQSQPEFDRYGNALLPMTPSLWNPGLFITVSGALLLIITLGSLFKIYMLREGGAAIARMLGGRLIPPASVSPFERRVLNIVEEMAIASGVKVPPVYVLDGEESINAFAAGFSPNEAVVAVSRGALDHLKRDELQGVIGHEFSHILNGDMGLNIRLMGVLHGILVIALTGYTLVRIMYYTPRSRSSRDDRGGGVQAAIALTGLLLLICGYVGVFFAKIIKMAVSRQREYLADSSAVQFTRNPSGLAGALKKIGGLVYGSRLENPRAEEASHMYFANGVRESFIGLFATHPPLSERIRRIDPSFDGAFPEVSAEPQAFEKEPPSAARLDFAAGAAPQKVDAAVLSNSVGEQSPARLDHARALINGIPENLAIRARDPGGASAVVYALLLNSELAVRTAQLKALLPGLDEGMQREIRQAADAVLRLEAAYKLPLLDLCLPALKLLGKSQYQTFKQNVRRLIEADQKMDLFEYTVQKTVIYRLDPVLLGRRRPPVGRRSLSALVEPCSDLLFALAFLGNTDREKAAAAYSAGAESCGIDPGLRRSPAEADRASLEMLDRALKTLYDADPAVKEPILKACIACISADGTVSVEEAELIRAVADALDLPLPPFFGAAQAA